VDRRRFFILPLAASCLLAPTPPAVSAEAPDADGDGVVLFVNDIYGDDRQLDVALAQGYPYPTRR